MSRFGRVGGRFVSLLVVAALVPVVVVLIVRATSEQPPRDTATTDANGIVAKVIDGDTIDITFGEVTERVRLIGIDTPEIAHPPDGSRPGNDAECFGPEATEFTRSLVAAGTPVRVERDIVARDDYGRLLGYVYRDDGSGGEVFINLELIRQGYAQPLSIEPNTTFQATFADAAREAEQSDLGLWSGCG